MAKKIRRVFSAVVLSVLLLVGLSCGVQAEEEAGEFPSKPIKLIVHWTAGGTTDLSARLLAHKAEKILGQPITVVNKGGGGGVTGLAVLADSKPDGYTIGTISDSAIAIAPNMRKVPYNPLKDFTTIIGYVNYIQGFTVRADSPWKTLKDFIAYARGNPRTIYVTSGAGSGCHLIVERLQLVENIKLAHMPYPGGQPAIAALLGGHASAASTGGEWVPHVKAGKLRALAVYTANRLDKFPEVPTLKELGYDIEGALTLGIGGPKGIPEPIVKRLHDAFKQALKDPECIEGLDKLAMPVVYLSSKELAKHNEVLYHEYGKVIRKLGLSK